MTNITKTLSGLTVAAALVGSALVLPVGAQSPDRSKPPASGPAPALKLPPIQKRALANGLPVWIVEMSKVPVVQVNLIVRAGAATDPSGKYGLASFTAAMLDEGAGSRDALQLADAIEFLGVNISTASSWDASTVGLFSPVSKLDDALPLMADVALHPTFSESEVDRLRKERLTSLIQQRDNAGSLASAAFARLVYGPRHRYGGLAMGNSVSNGEMTAQEIRAFHAQYYQPQNSHLLVVGDVKPETLLPKLERVFGAWKTGPAPAKPALGAAAQHAAKQIYLIDRPGAAQSQIRIGWIGVPRSTPDFYVLEVLNTVLGGSFTSRLNQNLRERNGYSYGAGSTFDMRSTAGPFFASSGVQTDKTVESLREFFNELNGIRKPIPADELERAKNYQALSFPAGFETTGSMAAQLSELVVYGLNESLFAEYVGKVKAVTAAEALRAASQYIQPDKFAVIVVGDLSKIEAPIRAAKLGPVRVVPVDEVLK
ncbi:MAG: pitrilysin family protein [Vicinamibacterales bacterium]